MVGLGVIVMFAGYSLAYYGLTQIRGGNWGLFDLVNPVAWAKPGIAGTLTDSQAKGS